MNFYFFGDSICFGQYISIEKTWICKSAVSLNKIYNDTYTVLNPSIIGNTTRDALQRFHHDVLKVNSDIIYIQFGMNDCNIWDDCNGVERVLPETFKSNLIELYTNAIAFGVKKIIFGTNHTSKKNTDYDLRNKEYNNIIRCVCLELNVDLIDNEQYIIKNKCDNYLLPDGIYLNEFGHDLYYKNFINSIIHIL